MKKGVVLCLMLIFFGNSFVALAKKASKDELELVKTGAIFENNVASNYYCFYIKEKQGGGKTLYQLEILNKDLTTKAKMEMVLDKLTIVKSIVRNGDAFAIEYASSHPDKPKSTIEFYDAAGKKLSSWEKENANLYFEAVKGVGYLKVENIISPREASVLLLDNSGKEVWKFTDEKIAKVKSVGALIEYTSENVIAVQFIGVDYQAMYFINTKTGKEMFSYDLKEKGYYYDYQRIDFQMVNDQIIMYGQENVYNENNKLDMHAGFFIKTFDMRGKLISDKHYNWTKDLTKYFTFKESSGEINRKMLFFDLIKSGDKFFAICQKYNIDKNEILTDSTIISDKKSVSSSTSRYFVIFQLDSKMEIENVKLAPTELKSYNFIERSETEKEFSIIACEGASNTIKDVAVTSLYDPIKDMMIPGGKKAFVHSVTLDKSGKLTTAKLELDGKSTYVSVYPAVPGQICYMFYKEKGKDYERKLLPLN